MIASLTGTLAAKAPTEVLLDVHGIGYSVVIPLSTYDILGPVGSTMTLVTHLVVREDVLALYGFGSEDERTVFRLLLSVNGIGPKMAVAILSGMKPDELRRAISRGDAGALTGIPGVGKKLADRLVVELQDRIGAAKNAASPDEGIGGDIKGEAALALVSLGFNKAAADKAVRAALLEDASSASSLESLIKASLRRAQR